LYWKTSNWKYARGEYHHQWSVRFGLRTSPPFLRLPVWPGKKPARGRFYWTRRAAGREPAPSAVLMVFRPSVTRISASDAYWAMWMLRLNGKPHLYLGRLLGNCTPRARTAALPILESVGLGPMHWKQVPHALSRHAAAPGNCPGAGQ